MLLTELFHALKEQHRNSSVFVCIDSVSSFTSSSCLGLDQSSRREIRSCQYDSPRSRDLYWLAPTVKFPEHASWPLPAKLKAMLTWKGFSGLVGSRHGLVAMPDWNGGCSPNSLLKTKTFQGFRDWLRWLGWYQWPEKEAPTKLGLSGFDI